VCLAASDPYASLCEADGVNRAIRVLPRMGAGHRFVHQEMNLPNTTCWSWQLKLQRC